MEAIDGGDLSGSHAAGDFSRTLSSTIRIFSGNESRLPSTAKPIAGAYSRQPASHFETQTSVPRASYEYSPDQSETADNAGFPGVGVLILFGCGVAVMIALGWIRRKTRLESGVSGAKTLSAYREV
jgi:hypothetical protein